MSVAVWLLIAYAVAGGLYWLLNALTALRTIRAVPRLEDLHPPPILPALLLPVASVILAGFIIRAACLRHRRGGIVWRGTLYPTDTLRAGARVRFP